MASPARPTDELLIEAARAHVLRLCGPGKAPRVIIIHVDGVKDAIKLPILAPCCPASEPVAPAAASPRFVANEFQNAILDALSGKALRTDALAHKVGDRRKLFKPGGIKELIEAGLVANQHGLGYYSTDDPPEEMEGGRP